MSKKYTPSGYQIINIDLRGKTSGTPFAPETEDEKLLHEILSSGELKKPILLRITLVLANIMGFGTVFDNTITLIGYGVIGDTASICITADSDSGNLSYSVLEE